MLQEGLNRAVWGEPGTVREYTRAQGFTDEGERALYALVAERVRGEPILDLGVGAGRTVPLLRPLASRYIAIDYAPQMVDACRARFPDVDVRVGDATSLADFEREQFGLVVFSFNGLDAIDHEKRSRALAEVGRVLRPGGYFWFSTLNMDGMGRRMRPWLPQLPKYEGAPLRYLVKTLRVLAGMPRRIRNRARLRPQFARGEGWCLETLSAHDYGLLMHYTSLSRELWELVEAGFENDFVVLDSSFGKRLRVGDDCRDVFWFQILARKK